MDSEKLIGIVNAYGVVLEKRESRVIDSKMLPYPKEQILAALIFAYMQTKDETLERTLESGIMLLATFQDNVGDKLSDKELLNMMKNLHDVPKLMPLMAGDPIIQNKIREEENIYLKCI